MIFSKNQKAYFDIFKTLFNIKYIQRMKSRTYIPDFLKQKKQQITTKTTKQKKIDRIES